MLECNGLSNYSSIESLCNNTVLEQLVVVAEDQTYLETTYGAHNTVHLASDKQKVWHYRPVAS